MTRRPDREARSGGYALGFGLMAALLGGMTLILVLVVLPRRYVLNAGLRESGVSFPTEAAPFAPPQELRREAPPPPPPAQPVPRGPAEILWEEVGPLLSSGQYAAALPRFEAYLEAHPEDRGALREFAIALSKAGRPERAATAFGQLLPDGEYPGIRLLLARTLRDLGRLEESSAHYASLAREKPGDMAMALEWARALSWGKDYEGAAGVLTSALAVEPESAELRAELAQVFYWSGHLGEAAEILSRMDQDALDRTGAVRLKSDVMAALAPPEAEEAAGDPLPATALQRAVTAVAEEDYEEAARLYAEALRESPGDTAAWRAYADLLQFGLEDEEGAREALLRLEALGAGDTALRFRLAQLDVWTGRNGEAMERFRSLLAEIEMAAPPVEPGDTAGMGPEDAAEVRALLGDLQRWEGQRVLSGESYRAALGADGANERARAGLKELLAEADRVIGEEESPRVGGNALTLVDSDEFSRVDLGAEAVRVDGSWVWAVRTGSRWMGGFDLGGLEREERGWYLELEPARWWRMGTVRTGVHLGLEQVRPDATDIAYGASLRLAELWGFRTDLRYDHGPAYPITVTLQSVFAKVVQDRFAANLARRVGDRWSLSLAGDAALLGAVDAEGPAGGSSNGDVDDRSLRLEGGMSLGRSLTPSLTLGVTARALAYTGPSPVVDGLRLYWDPNALFSGGLFAQLEKDLAPAWTLRGRVNPSLAFIDERSRRGFERVPHFSAEAGLSYLGGRFRATVDAFYYQGRFDGYNAYGLRVGLGAWDGFGKRGAR